ncbi:glycoside hydrolase family 1 protein [Pseudoclavibacter sp. RFBA6]|uniref:glycoside hydrolase family 1 protein n=1 Tax=Pseudoclavibacter sp. RFBA6 TaxID=2080573 RepID=UPI000CE7C902|nr:family 1 glycosylhydrolase [Pseudoclavibacter sp. RFBA6]PPG39611.1 beta-glucosidase [Pseudoclavibacter sp. RFBA6]
MTTSFPTDFLWGVAQAGHQNEGDNRHSDIWFLEQTTPSLFRERSGAACDGYARWESDLDLVVGLGLNSYRFSVEWARVEPQRGVIDESVLDHYEALVDGCVARGLAPIVTLNHFAAPHWFSAAGSWLAEDAASLFAAHSARVLARFGDRIRAVVTLNEPNLEQLLQAGGKLPPELEVLKLDMLAAAAEAAGTERYFASNVIPVTAQVEFRDAFTLAHVAARAAIKAVCPELPVGVSIAISDDVAIAGGESSRDAKRAAVYDHWLRVAQDDDFIGVQNYERDLHGPDGSFVGDGPRNGMGTVIEPASLAGAVRYAHEVSGVPVLVTEHGIQTDDDAQRAEFIPAALESLGELLAEGVPVLGYQHWTLMDNFEWIFGYGPKLGLFSVDRTTFERTAKPSAAAYAAAVAAARSVRV